MKKVRVEIGAVMEVYIEDNQTEDDAVEIVKEQVRRLDESESGIHDPDLYLANYLMNILDVENEEDE